MLPSLSIVIPAFNEAASIEASVRDALEVGAAHAAALEVVVCDDGSRDDTAAIAGAVAARDRRVVVLRRPVNRGIEASRRAVFDAGRVAASLALGAPAPRLLVPDVDR